MNAWEPSTPAELAAAFDAEHKALPVHNTSSERAIIRKYISILRQAPSEYVMAFARELLFSKGLRWQAYEVLAAHHGAFHNLGETQLEELGQGINSWWTVDAFARTLSGPAWQVGLVPDELFVRWAHSPDLWWRRAALVSTVAFNVHSLGGQGDTPRTLAICRLLVADHEDMVVKALSWALRMLVFFDPEAVEAFIQEYDPVLAGRVKREVGSKLRTGLKNPRKTRSN